MKNRRTINDKRASFYNTVVKGFFNPQFNFGVPQLGYLFSIWENDYTTHRFVIHICLPDVITGLHKRSRVCYKNCI
jgi:hypothetical protein